MGHIFISYSHKDTAYVEKLEKKLISEGFDVWVDHRIDYGSQWPKEIQGALDTCDAFIVVVSENAYESKWVQNEVARAGRKGKPFFPLLLQGDAWLAIEAVQYVDVRNSVLPPDKFYERLATVFDDKEKVVDILPATKEISVVSETSCSQKRVEFLEHYPKRDWNTDSFVCAFVFSVQEIHLIGTPYEIATSHRVIVKLTDELVINWHLWGNDGGEGFSLSILKVAFQSAEEYISSLVMSGETLPKELDPLDRTTKNSPQFCPYNIGNISYPDKGYFVVGGDRTFRSGEKVLSGDMKNEIKELKEKLRQIERVQNNPFKPPKDLKPGEKGWNIK